MNGREAYFALVGIRMMALSQKYNRKLEDLHIMFYTVSCDWKKLETLLQAEGTAPDQINDMTWKPMEDLAAKDKKDSEAYKYIIGAKGEKEV